MGTGGKRANSGRKKGGKNRFNKALAQAAAEAGDSPLDFLLRVMRDKTKNLEFRIEAAGKALPYLHKRKPQDISIDAVFQTPPPVLFVLGPPPDMPDDYMPPDEGGTPN